MILCNIDFAKENEAQNLIMLTNILQILLYLRVHFWRANIQTLNTGAFQSILQI